VLAVVKHAWMVDHFVAVMALDDRTVVIGDPIAGRLTHSREQFERKWRFMGVVLSRDSEADEKNLAPAPNSGLTASY
jgi:predicted double-glycine peptidase